MALSGSSIYSEVGFAFGAGGGTHTATGCVLPASSLIVVNLGCLTANLASNTFTIANSGTGLTWTKQTDVASGAGSAATQSVVWTAPNTSGQTVNITITSNDGSFASDGLAAGMEISAWTGYDTVTPVGLVASSSLNGSNTGILNYSLGGTASSSSAIVASVACDGDHGAALVDGGSGYTELYKAQSGTGGWFRFTSEYKVGALTSVDFGALTDPYQYSSVAIEIKAAGGGGGGVDANPTGVVATASAGTPTVSGKANVTPTGVAATGTAGTPTVNAKATTNVTGVTGTGQAGTPTVTAAANAPVTGPAATAQVNTPTVSGKAIVSLTGAEATSQVGALTVSAGGAVSVAVSGVEATAAAGTPTVSAKAIVPLTGVEAAGAAGTPTVTAAAVASPPGAAAAPAVGTPTISGKAVTTITGVPANTSAGDLTVTVPSVTVTLVGVQAMAVVGTVTVAAGAANFNDYIIRARRRGRR